MSRRRYTRICVTCGKENKVGYKPKGNEECRSCASKSTVKMLVESRKNMKRIRYWYFCPKCNDIRQTQSKRKTNLCTDCNRKFCKIRKLENIYFDFKEMKMVTDKLPIPKPKPRFLRVCKQCGDERLVFSKQSAAKSLCRSCSVGRPRNRKSKVPKTYVSPEAIAKMREENRKHKEALIKHAKPKIIQTKTEEEMIAEFLAQNEPSVKAREDEPYPVMYQKMHGAGVELRY